MTSVSQQRASGTTDTDASQSVEECTCYGSADAVERSSETENAQQ
jgi:hypothetical protein